MPIAELGSRYRVGPLIGEGSRVVVRAVHVPPGGRIGRYAASAQQLLAVFTGQGWVSGRGGRRRDIGTGYAACWDATEDGEAFSDGGMSGISVEGDFEIWAAAVTADIVVSDYDAAWVRWFDTVRRHVWPVIADTALRIDHVGSTAVPGLAAKPIIDLDIVVAAEGDVRVVIDRLATIGYRWRGDLGVEGREAFAAPHNAELPAHHLYLVVENNRAHLDHWLLRDLLRAHAGARERYAALKRRNVDLAGDDMDVYVARKAALVAELLTWARAEHGYPAVTYWQPASSALNQPPQSDDRPT